MTDSCSVEGGWVAVWFWVFKHCVRAFRRGVLVLSWDSAVTDFWLFVDSVGAVLFAVTVDVVIE